jgi:hypothetical protein
MSALLGTSIAVFVGVNLLVVGLAAFLTGQSLAQSWRPAWQVIGWSLVLAAFSRFLIYGLYGGELLSLSGYLASVLSLCLIAGGSYYLYRARKVVQQYPWLYERAGPFGWRERPSSRLDTTAR